MKKHFLLLASLFCLSFTVVNAQNYTGKWEGIMDNEFLRVNIEQHGAEVCGFTFDSVLSPNISYCKARYEGRYDNEQKALYLSGVEFFANTGGHILMRLKLWKEPGDPGNVLHGMVIAKGFMNSFFGGDPSPVLLRRVSGTPEKVPPFIMAPCFPDPPKKTKPVTKITTPPKAKTIPPKMVTPVLKDTIKKPVPVIANLPKKEPAKPVAELIKRKQTEQARLIVNAPDINLKLYDNGVVDNDSVSVYFDGKLLLSHKRLSENPIEFNLHLEENSGIHQLTLFAENLGGIPPNTALIVVTAGGKRYELHSKASLDENAVLIFEYKKE